MPVSSFSVPRFKTRSRQIVRSLFRSRELHRDKNQRLKRQLKKLDEHRQRLVNEKHALERRVAQQAKELSRLKHERGQRCRLPADPVVANHNFGPKMVSLCVELAKTVGFRSVVEVLQIVQQWLDVDLKTPHWTTVRTWLCRCGVGLLQEAAVEADDWIWMIDHSVQLAKQNVLLILGIRQSDIPKGRPLARSDMAVLAIVPGDSRDKDSVALALNELAGKIGVPISIVADGASELHHGINDFEKGGKTVLVMDDIKHKAANILKHTLGKDPVFQEFESKLGTTTAQIQQTELAHFLPPRKKAKCRFMTLSPLLKWQRMAQHHLENPDSAEHQGVTEERLKQKLGWIEAFKEPAQQWRQCQAIVSCVLRFSNRNGVYRGATNRLKKQLAHLDLQGETVQKVYVQLVEVYQRCEERLLASPYSELRLLVSTEVLESTLGGFKKLQRQHTRGGFTSLLAALPTLMSKQSPNEVRRLLTKVDNKQWKEWVSKANLDNSTHAKKLEVYRNAKTHTGKKTVLLN